MKMSLSIILGSIATGFLYFMGGWDFALEALLIMIALDYITGVCKAIINRKLNSTIGAKGIAKKVGYLILVALSVLLDKLTGDSGAIRNLVIYFFTINEGISILENWGSMGLHLPKGLTNALEKLKEKE